MPIAGTLGAAAGTEIELVVTVNLILVLWLRVYDSQEARQEQLEKQIAQITDAELVSEFTTYTSVFRWVRRVRRWLWLAGAGTGVASAALLYMAVYLSYTGVLVVDAQAVWVSIILGFAAFTSPGVLSLMFLLGAVGNMIVKDSVPQFERWNGEKAQALKDRDRLDEVIAQAKRTRSGHPRDHGQGGGDWYSRRAGEAVATPQQDGPQDSGGTAVCADIRRGGPCSAVAGPGGRRANGSNGRHQSRPPRNALAQPCLRSPRRTLKPLEQQACPQRAP